jgi:hypothetical protein
LLEVGVVAFLLVAAAVVVDIGLILDLPLLLEQLIQSRWVLVVLVLHQLLEKDQTEAIQSFLLLLQRVVVGVVLIPPD